MTTVYDNFDLGHQSEFVSTDTKEGKTPKQGQQKPELVKLADKINNYKQEAYLSRQRQEPSWDANLAAYVGARAVLEGAVSGEGLVDGFSTTIYARSNTPGGLYAYTANRIKNVCLNKTAQLTQSDPTVHFVPRADASVSETFVMKPAAGQQIFLEMQAAQAAGAQGGMPPHIQHLIEVLGEKYKEVIQGDVSMTGDQYAALMAATNQDTGLPLFKVEDFVHVDDTVESEVLGTVYDAVWERSSGAEALKRECLAAFIFGWSPLMVSWNSEKKLTEYVVANNKNVYIDPVVESFHQSHYMIFDQVLSLDEAISIYPEHEEALRANAWDGSVFAGNDNSGTKIGNIFMSTTFKRPMATISTCWERYQIFDMTEAEAVEAGLVVVDSDGYTLPNGESITTDSKRWPTRSGVRETKIVNSFVLETGECDYSDIPMFTMRDIEIPSSPFGQGEPEQLRPVQNAIDSVITSIANNLLYSQCGQTVMASEVAAALPKGSQPFQRPGEVFLVPGELIQKYGQNLVFTVPPPKLPDNAYKSLEEMLSMFDQLSGNNDVQRGQASKDAESGVAIESLQQAGSITISLVAKSMEFMLARLADVVMNVLIEHLPEADWIAYCSQYPVGVIRDILNRQGPDHQHYVSVESAAGSGVVKRQQKNLLVQLAQLNKVSTETLLTGMDIPSAAQENSKIAHEMVEAQKIMAQAQPQQQGQGQPEPQAQPSVPTQPPAPEQQTQPQILQSPQVKAQTYNAIQ